MTESKIVELVCFMTNSEQTETMYNRERGSGIVRVKEVS